MRQQEYINKEDVTFLVMYDISDTYTRDNVVTYLLREGCLRIQKSIFMGNLPYYRMKAIAESLKETCEAYDNNDSYIIIPLRKESVDGMIVCGNHDNIDMILRRKPVVFL